MKFFAALKTNPDGTQVLVRREYDSDDESYVTIVERSLDDDRPNVVSESHHYDYDTHLKHFNNAVFEHTT